MMGSCAFLMPAACVRFVRSGRYDLRAALGLTLAGTPAVADRGLHREGAAAHGGEVAGGRRRGLHCDRDASLGGAGHGQAGARWLTPFSRSSRSSSCAPRPKAPTASSGRSGPFDLIALGIGAIIGAGLFVRTAAAAANNAGPSVTLGFIVAAVGCAFAGLCYAEFASMIPIAGSAYTYSYATMGELVAWIIGWDLILEYAIGAATVGIAWSEYLNKLLEYVRPAHPVRVVPLAVRERHRRASPASSSHGIMNVPALFIVAHADAAAHPRHPRVGVRQRHHRHHQGRDRHPVHRHRLGLHQPGQPRPLHPARRRPTSTRRASRTTSAA